MTKNLDIIKIIYDKPIANIIMNGGMENIFLILGPRQACIFSLLYNTMFEPLTKAPRQEEYKQKGKNQISLKGI